MNDFLICRRCGKKMDNGTTFCPDCGTSVYQRKTSNDFNICKAFGIAFAILGIISAFVLSNKLGVSWSDTLSMFFSIVFSSIATSVLFITVGNINDKLNNL